MSRFLSLLIAQFFLVFTISAESMITGKPNYKSIDEWLVFGQKHLRRAYRSGATGPYAFDCSGFTMYMFKELGVSLPHNSAEQFKYGEKVSQKHAQKGDLVFYAGSKGNGIGHVGIIYEVNSDNTFTFIHASTSQGVIIDQSEHPYYKSRFKGIKRITTDEEIADVLGLTKKKKREKEKEQEETKEEIVVPREEVKEEEKKDAVKESVEEVKKEEKKEVEEKKDKKKKKRAAKNKKKKAVKEDVAKKETLPAKEETKQNTEEATDILHTVKAGETLYAISRLYSVSVAEIQEWNDLKGTNLSIGQVLRIKRK